MIAKPAFPVQSGCVYVVQGNFIEYQIVKRRETLGMPSCLLNEYSKKTKYQFQICFFQSVLNALIVKRCEATDELNDVRVLRSRRMYLMNMSLNRLHKYFYTKGKL